MFACVLLGCGGAVQAAPAAGDEQAPQEVWGDPEDQEETENASGWTWFGMGYESRRSGLSPYSSDGLRDPVHEPGNGAGGRSAGR